mgnify:CR=1 FL=1
MQEQNVKRQEYFTKKTNELFSTDFKGFGFKVGEKEMVFNPGNVDKMKTTQSDITNFINAHINEDGFIKDAAAYHKSLAVAMNPEKFAQFFYDQGVSATVDNVSRKSKNINMDIRNAAQQTVTKDGMKIRAVGDTDSGRGLKIRSIKKV